MNAPDDLQQLVAGFPAKCVIEQAVERVRCQQARGVRGLSRGVGQFDLYFGHQGRILSFAVCLIKLMLGYIRLTALSRSVPPLEGSVYIDDVGPFT